DSRWQAHFSAIPGGHRSGYALQSVQSGCAPDTADTCLADRSRVTSDEMGPRPRLGERSSSRREDDQCSRRRDSRETILQATTAYATLSRAGFGVLRVA